MIITIDGPAASGKSSAARLLANKLNFMYMSTGLLYRALAYILVKHFGYNHITIVHAASIDITHALNPQFFQYFPDKGSASILYKDVDIINKLKSPDVDQWSSLISQNTQVRQALVSIIRKCVDDKDVVVEGRDCGSVIFPQAKYKFYLTAPLEVRAKRWQEYEAKRGMAIALDQAIELIRERDERDTTRKVDPLVVPEGAHVIDNSTLTLEQTVESLQSYLK